MARIQPEFQLIKSVDGHYWSAFFPTQRTKVKTRKEAEILLARTVYELLERQFTVVDLDLTDGSKNKTYIGGIRQLLTKYASRADYHSPIKRVEAARIHKAKRKRPAKGNRSKK